MILSSSISQSIPNPEPDPYSPPLRIVRLPVHLARSEKPNNPQGKPAGFRCCVVFLRSEKPNNPQGKPAGFHLSTIRTQIGFIGLLYPKQEISRNSPFADFSCWSKNLVQLRTKRRRIGNIPPRIHFPAIHSLPKVLSSPNFLNLGTNLELSSKKSRPIESYCLRG
jgi:hypothetical protein